MDTHILFGKSSRVLKLKTSNLLKSPVEKQNKQNPLKMWKSSVSTKASQQQCCLGKLSGAAALSVMSIRYVTLKSVMGSDKTMPSVCVFIHNH